MLSLLHYATLHAYYCKQANRQPGRRLPVEVRLRGPLTSAPGLSLGVLYCYALAYQHLLIFLSIGTLPRKLFHYHFAVVN